MALLYEKVPTFEDTWIECLDELARDRRRMAIEDDNMKDREQQFYYAKSLCVPIPFLSTRRSIMTLFDPHLNGTPMRLQEMDAAFVRAHGVLFSGKSSELFTPSVTGFVDSLDRHIARNTKGWLDCGYFIAITLGCAMLEYGSESNPVMMAIKTSRTEDADVQMEDLETSVTVKFLNALDFAVRTRNVVFLRSADPNVNPYLHVTLSFLYHMSHFATAMGYIELEMPLKLISLILNSLLKGCALDFAQRGLLCVDKYYPDDWFTAKLDDNDKYWEVASMTDKRRERCLWLVPVIGIDSEAEPQAGNDGDVVVPDVPDGGP
ncbi:hypothetical protein LX36DRAFT_682387 [Colletotrichum falcatum]|nr:hypothetical protein LX36DRAFT_682387 [Colletotrichum falcatum]